MGTTVCKTRRSGSAISLAVAEYCNLSGNLSVSPSLRLPFGSALYGTPVRYVRDTILGGSTANTGNHWMEIYATSVSGGLVSIGKTVTSNYPPDTWGSGTLTTIVDDDPWTEATYTSIPTPNTSTPAQVTIDLGQVYTDLSQLRVWHYQFDGRTYYGTKTEVSEDGTTWHTVFDSAITGIYVEPSFGHIVPHAQLIDWETESWTYIGRTMTNLNLGAAGDKHFANIYNNLGNTASLVKTGELYHGSPVFRLSLTPTTAAQLTGLQQNFWGQGVYTDGIVWEANVRYMTSCYWRPVSARPMEVGGTAANYGGWTDINGGYSASPSLKATEGWNRAVATYLNATQYTDGKFWSVRCPTAVLNEPVVIEFCGLQIEKTSLTPWENPYLGRQQVGRNWLPNNTIANYNSFSVAMRFKIPFMHDTGTGNLGIIGWSYHPILEICPTSGTADVGLSIVAGPAYSPYDRLLRIMGDFVTATGTLAIQDNAEYALLLTYDGSTVKVYINGVLALEKAAAITWNSAWPIMIGGGYRGRPEIYVRDVEVFQSVLTPQQALDLFDADSTSFASTKACSEMFRIVSEEYSWTDVSTLDWTAVQDETWFSYMKVSGAAESLNAGKRLSEAFSTADSMSRSAAFSRNLPESLSTTDAMSRSAEFIRQLAEALTATDAAKFTSTKRLSETLLTTDVMSRSVEFSRQFSEIVDILGGEYDWRRASFTWADSAERYWTMAENVTIGYAIFRDFLEMLAVSESVKAAIGLNKDEAVQVIEARVCGMQKPLSDSFAVAEADGRDVSAFKSEAFGIAETLARAADFQRAIAEALTLTDAQKYSASLAKAESLAVAESFSRIGAFSREIAEALATADTQTNDVELRQGETVSVSDVYTRIATFARAFAEVFATADSSKNSASVFKGESLGVSEGSAMVVEFVRAIAEALAVAESQRSAVSIAKSESVSVAETNTSLAEFVRAIAETFAFAESDKKDASIPVAESMGISDSRASGFSKDTAESFAVAEGHSKGVSIQQSDAFAIAEAEGKQFYANKAEALAVSDAYERIVDFSRALAESVAVAESGGRDASVAKSESVSVVEAIAKGASSNHARSLAVSESVLKSQLLALAEAMQILGGGYDWANASFDWASAIDKTWVANGGFASDVTKRESEGVAVSDSMSRTVSFARQLAEALAIADTTGKSTALSLAESVSVLDAILNGFDIFRDFAESLGITDSAAKVAVFERVIAEALVIAEARASSSSIAKGESLAVAESNSKSAGKPVSEALGVSEASFNAPGKNALETLAIAEQYGSVSEFARVLAETLAVVDSAGRTADFSRAFAEAFALAEAQSSSVGSNHSEAFTLSESRKGDLAKALTEVVAVAELASKWQTLPRSESFAIADSNTRTAQFSRAFSEVLNVAEFIAKTQGVSIAEALGVIESFDRAAEFSRALAEALSVVDAAKKDAAIAKSEAITAQDDRSAEVGKGISELINATDSLANSASVLKAETFSVAESQDKTAEKGVSESVAVTEAIQKASSILKTESVALAEAFGRNAVFNRAIAEGLSVAEALKKTVSIPKSEAFAIGDELRRNSQAVISDILINSGDITLEQFTALLAEAQAPGYGPFVQFSEGDHEYQNAIFKAIVTAKDGASARLTDLSVGIDVPDVFDNGTAAVTNLGATVLFTRTFYEKPEVNVSLKGGSIFAIPRVTSIERDRFTVELVDATGNRVAGTVTWAAHGY